MLSEIYLIIPVYNEAKYLPQFFNKLLIEVNKCPTIKKLIFVNDGSTDETKKLILAQKLNDKRIVLLNHEKNKGKGEAMKTGLKFAKDKADAVIFIDGDNQHDPKFLPLFIKKLEKYPIVFGYRKLLKDSPWIRKSGNRLAGVVIEKVFKIKRKDLLCGFMAFRKDIFKKLYWDSKGYGVEAELTAIVGRNKISYSEVLISTIYLDRAKGVTWKHAAKILLTFPKWYFSIKNFND